MADWKRAWFTVGAILLVMVGVFIGYAFGTRFASLQAVWMLLGGFLGMLANVAINGRALVRRVRERLDA